MSTSSERGIDTSLRQRRGRWPDRGRTFSTMTATLAGFADLPFSVVTPVLDLTVRNVGSCTPPGSATLATTTSRTSFPFSPPSPIRLSASQRTGRQPFSAAPSRHPQEFRSLRRASGHVSFHPPSGPPQDSDRVRKLLRLLRQLPTEAPQLSPTSDAARVFRTRELSAPPLLPPQRLHRLTAARSGTGTRAQRAVTIATSAITSGALQFEPGQPIGTSVQDPRVPRTGQQLGADRPPPQLMDKGRPPVRRQQTADSGLERWLRDTLCVGICLGLFSTDEPSRHDHWPSSGSRSGAPGRLSKS